jgi:hypothetical protein
MLSNYMALLPDKYKKPSVIDEQLLHKENIMTDQPIWWPGNP